MKRALWLSSGVIVWAIHFVAIYGYTGLACARAMERSVPWAVGGATLIAATAALAILARAMRTAGRSFESWMAAGIAALALIAILWETLPVMILPVCR